MKVITVSASLLSLGRATCRRWVFSGVLLSLLAVGCTGDTIVYQLPTAPSQTSLLLVSQITHQIRYEVVGPSGATFRASYTIVFADGTQTNLALINIFSVPWTTDWTIRSFRTAKTVSLSTSQSSAMLTARIYRDGQLIAEQTGQGSVVVSTTLSF